MDTRLRLNIAACLALLPLLPLSLRLAHLQIMQHQSLESMARGEFNRSSVEILPRSDILDRNGNILAQSVLVWSCFLDKKMIKKPAALAARLAPLIGMPESEILNQYKLQVRFVRLSDRLSFDQASAVTAARIEGVGLSSKQERFYPNGGLARSLLGQVNSEGYGLSGIELSLNEKLLGKARKFKIIRDGSGRTIHKETEQDPAPPEPLSLTIDRNIQFYAEQALQEAAEQFSIKSGVVAVQDPNNGEILAMAAYPENPLRNSLVQDSYEPGSTFKIVAAAAALEEEVVNLDETFFCENGSYQIAPGVVIHDHEPAGSLSLAQILEKSSNIGMAKVAARLGAVRFYRYVRAFGFSNKTGVSLPGETGGMMKPLPSLGHPVNLATASYGYGIGVSPLQMLDAYSAVANGGTLWEPLLVKNSKPSRVRRLASPKTMETLSRMLETIVRQGTGVTAQIPGYRVAGKTGTARKLDPETKKYSMTQYNASFVGFLPAGKPSWTVLVVIEDPKGLYYGAQVAAPVFAKLGKRLLALKGISRQI
ncbi:MAG: penicillin-binding protein 2 [Elusimicrobia bacterium]|nr:penicillin-binding protein 2 [Elusimicrobiota bacterium]